MKDKFWNDVAACIADDVQELVKYADSLSAVDEYQRIVYTNISDLVDEAIGEEEQCAIAGDFINHNILQTRIRVFSGTNQECNILSIYMDDEGSLILDIEEVK